MGRWPISVRMLLWGALIVCEVAAGLSLLILPDPTWGFLLAAVVPVLMLLYAKPLLGYMFMIFFLPNYGINLFNVSATADVSLMEPAVAIACLSWFLLCVKQGRLKLSFTGLDLPIFAIFIWAGISILWAPGAFRSAQQIIKIMIVLTVYFLSVQMVNSKKDLRWVLGAWIALSIVVSVVGIYQVVTTGLHASTQYVYTEAYTKIHRDVRTTSLFEGSDMAAFLLSMAVVYGVTRYTTLEPGGWRRFTWFLMPLFMFTLVTTISRKSYLATAVAVVYLSYSSAKMRKAIMSVAPVLGLAVAVILAGAFSAAIMERLQSFLLPPQEAIPNRYETWNYGIGFFFDSPLIGNGLGSFFVLATLAQSPLVFPHNFYLFILVEFGVVGMALVLLWGYQFFSSFRKYRHTIAEDETYLLATGLTAGAIVIVLHAFFRSFSLTDPTFWGYFGMTSAFLKVYPPKAAESLAASEEVSLPDAAARLTI